MGYKDSSDVLQNFGKDINAAIYQLVGTARTNPSQLVTLAKVTSATAQLIQFSEANAFLLPMSDKKLLLLSLMLSYRLLLQTLYRVFCYFIKDASVKVLLQT